MPRKYTPIVYFVRAPMEEMVKVGFTECGHAKRLSQLRAASPSHLVPLGYREGAVADERAVHVRFAHLWSHGEWFREAPELLDYIREECEPWPDVTTRVRSRKAGSGKPVFMDVIAPSPTLLTDQLRQPKKRSKLKEERNAWIDDPDHKARRTRVLACVMKHSISLKIASEAIGVPHRTLVNWMCFEAEQHGTDVDKAFTKYLCLDFDDSNASIAKDLVAAAYHGDITRSI